MFKFALPTLLLSLFITDVYAAQCKQFYDLSQGNGGILPYEWIFTTAGALDMTNVRPGETGPVSSYTINSRWYDCGVIPNLPRPPQIGITQLYVFYRPLFPLDHVDSNGFAYFHINEYVTLAVKIYDAAGVYDLTGQSERKVTTIDGANNPGSRSYQVVDMGIMQGFFFLRKQFIGEVDFEATDVFHISINTRPGESRGPTVMRMKFRAKLTSKQRCSFDTSNGLLNVDFGKIPSYAFSRVQPGEKAENVNTAERTLNLNCTNDLVDTNLGLFVNSVGAQGDIIKSTNPDIGFKVSAEDGRVITPNNKDNNNAIPLRLTQGEGSAKIKFWPVSINGNTPVAGKFSGTGSITFDFM